MEPLSSPWTVAPALNAPAPGEVHVWCSSLERPPEEVSRLLALLSNDERERAARFRVAGARDEYVVARGLLRTLLGRCLSCDPRQITFRHGPQGKPKLPEPVPLDFNVSHSGGYALFAVSTCGEVGVDIERVRPFANALDLADRFFCPSEAAALRAHPEESRRDAFLHVWTRKEAFIKACGTGLAHGLERFEVSVPPDEPARVLRIDGTEGPARGWSLRALAPVPGYVGALAREGNDYRLRCWYWPEE
jgi:4'-phosphopantetheinyl transferase